MVVVIAILAAITIVTYNGISQKSRISALQSELSQTAKALESERLRGGIDTYPSLLSDIRINSSKLTYRYNSRSNTFCVDGKNGTLEYSVRNDALSPVEGACIRNGMAVWLPLNGDTVDKSGNGHTAALTNAPTPTTGAGGLANGAYSFSGGNQYMTISSADTIPSQTDTFTASIWAKGISSTGSDYGYFALRGANTSIGSSVFWLGTNSGLPQYVVASAVGKFANGITTVPSDASTWHNTVLVYAGGYQTIYVDGTQRIDVSIGAMTNTTTGTTLTLGGSALSFRTITGALDDFRVYNRALVSSEVTALYDAGAE